MTPRRSALRPRRRRRTAQLRGVMAVAAVVAVFELVAQLVGRRPDPAAPLLLAVVYAAFAGGSSGGIVAAILATVYAVFSSMRDAGGALIADDHTLIRGLVFAPSAAAVALIAGAMQHHAEERYARERRHGERIAALEHAKTQFLNLASHELRGPLGVVSGYVSMIRDGSFGPAEAADVTRILPVMQLKLQEMTTLVDQMLETARLEENRLTLALQPLDLREVVDSSVEAVRPFAGPHHQVLYRSPAQPVPVTGDGLRLGIIVYNLLHNAIKYSPAGGVVQCFLGGDGERAVVTVWDHGLGIAEEDLPRLFTRFGRILTRENSSISGTGLGLYLARELAHLHGGDITVRSAPGEGSTFTLALPLLPAEALAATG